MTMTMTLGPSQLPCLWCPQALDSDSGSLLVALPLVRSGSPNPRALTDHTVGPSALDHSWVESQVPGV